MKRLLYPIIACCTALLLLSACTQENDMSGGTASEDGNSILLDFASTSLPASRTVAATGVEVKVDHIDVLIFEADETGGAKKHYERVNSKTDGGSGTIALTAKRTDFDPNVGYWVYLIANSTAEESVFAAEDFDLTKLKGLTQTDEDIHMTGCPKAANVPETFLMDGIAYPEGETEPAAASTVILNNGDRTVDTRLKVTLRRAAAKLVIQIHQGKFVEFDNSLGPEAGYYLRNMPYTTSVVAGVDGEAELRTSSLTPQNEYFSWTQDDPSDPDNPYTLITVTAYAYAHTWENESAMEKETRLIVNIPMRAISHNENDEYLDTDGNVVDDVENAAVEECENSYYQIPVCRGTSLERNTCYVVSLTLNVPGGTNPMDPVKLNELTYSVLGWEDETIDIGGAKDPPIAYLTLNTDYVEMHNIEKDNTTLQFVSSSEVTVTIDKVYYKNSEGKDVTLDADAQAKAHISVTPDDGLTGNININSDVPDNNAIRYIELTITNGEKVERNVTIAQYPLEYITNVVGYYSYRSDFGEDGDDGNPTTYVALNGQVATKGTVESSSEISTRRVSCYYYNNKWEYENRRYHDYLQNEKKRGQSFFASKVAKATNDGYAIYYYHWELLSGNNYTYEVESNDTKSTDDTKDVAAQKQGTTYYYPGDKITTLTNPRMYHVQITATSSDYTLGKPRLDTEDYTASDEYNAKLVSPSFMIASQLGSTISAASATIAKQHCKQYVEVAKDGTVYNDWRLPTRAEIGIINKYQLQSPGVIAEVLTAKTYWCADEEVVTILDENGKEKEDGDEKRVRCVRDAY